jgi:hypothetical protein
MLPETRRKPSTSATTRMADQVLSCSLFDQPMENSADQADKDKKKDPLSSQVWRMYTKAKDTLPNGSRLENLTWRMMAMTLKKDISDPTDSAPEKKDPVVSKSPPMVYLELHDTSSSNPIYLLFAVGHSKRSKNQ